MKYSIYYAQSASEIKICHEILEEVFHRELNLYQMHIPDKYDKFSQYVKICYEQSIIGTCRIVFPNSDVGLPIEETGFDLTKFDKDLVAEASRLVMIKNYRGKVPFSKIVYFCCETARKFQMSDLVIAILPQNLRLFKRHGFQQYGEPLYDYSVKSSDNEESIIIPMIIKL